MRRQARIVSVSLTLIVLAAAPALAGDMQNGAQTETPQYPAHATAPGLQLVPSPKLNPQPEPPSVELNPQPEPPSAKKDKLRLIERGTVSPKLNPQPPKPE